ncbi:glycosyltransferase family 2 protein [Anaerocolumna sp. MB42-C2]|uniref:glycosyltransferase family 2 protein n=1 Tax=Anaerocolumna sp. MB42-C2 TaxID=3070997 RepID=UPI0027E0FA88|nr:glycosyltransferase family 2 protein [Anaerocolumna sp. MB42-C2]WMJ89687.1 glycosyltransferase family 2 protein [Anaerocolumna sp. MB42-C2]
MKLLIIIPVYNEEHNIEKVITQLKKYVPYADYIVVNDCSNDNTVSVCKEKGYHYISLPVNLGIGGGVQAGYHYAIEHDYDIAVQMDGDGQHDAKYIENIIKPIVDEEADIVIGSRFILKQGFQSSRLRRMGINFLSMLIKICSGTRVKDVTSGFRAVNRKFIKIYSEEYSQDYPEPEAIIAGAFYKGRIKEVPVIMHEREAGSSSIHSWKSIYYMIKVSIAIFTYRLKF